MKILEAKDIFDQLVDVFADEGVADWEFSRHLNTAMAKLARMSTYNRFIKRGPADEPLFAMEQSTMEAKDLDALYYESVFTPTVAGLVTYEEIRALFPDDIVRGPSGVISEGKPDILSILALETTNGYPVYWTRHNDAAILRRNKLSRPTVDAPHVQKTRLGLRIEPVVDVLVKVNRMPLHVWYEEGDETTWVDPELGDGPMYDAIYRAIILSGIQIRDAELQQAVANVANY